MIKSHDCIYKDFSSDWYTHWGKIIGFPKVTHAKFWEIAAIAQALEDRGALKPGKKGLGFGVGREQLVSVFARSGVDVVATDQKPDSTSVKNWDNGQLANGKSSLYYPKIVGKKDFDSHVTFKHHDMNKLEKSFEGTFDFCWSNCVIGHLGSTEKSMRYIERHARYLKPNGLSVLTTELNISSFNTTVSDNSDTIVFLLSELYEMFERAAKVGLQAEKFTLKLGNTTQDLNVNYLSTELHRNGFEKLVSSGTEEAFIKIPFSNFAITQILLVFRKRPNSKLSPVTRRLLKLDQAQNTRRLKTHISKNALLKDYFETYPANIGHKSVLKPVKNKISLRMKKGETKSVTLKFSNESQHVFSDLSENHPYNLSPLVLATADPINRESVFHEKSWFSGNRPSVVFKSITPATRNESLAHRFSPGKTLSYELSLKAPRKAGTYTESFCLIAEGKADFDSSSRVTVTVEVR